MQGNWGKTKPPAGTPLQWGHPLTNGLRCMFPFNEGAGVQRSITEGRLAIPQQSSVWAQGVRGFALRHIATPDHEYIVTDSADLVPTQNCTIALGYRKTDTTNRASSAFGVNQNTTGRCNVHLPWSDGVVYWDFGGFAVGVTRVSVAGLTFSDDFWVFSTGARGMEIWQNGLLRASNTANPTRVNTGNTFNLGRMSLAVPSDLADTSYFALWNRQLSQQEIVSLTGAPFQIFQPGLFTFTPYAAALRRNRTLMGVGL